jgi:hypothetical protein
MHRDSVVLNRKNNAAARGKADMTNFNKLQGILLKPNKNCLPTMGGQYV